MDYNLVIVFIVVVAGVAGFLVLADTLLENWRAGSWGKEESDAYQSQRTRDFEKCFNDCMSSERWEPDKRDVCDSFCRSQGDSYSQPISFLEACRLTRRGRSKNESEQSRKDSSNESMRQHSESFSIPAPGRWASKPVHRDQSPQQS